MAKVVDRRNPKNEAEFRRLVIARAHELGWRVHTDPDLRLRMGDPGMPDLVLLRGDWDGVICVSARLMFRECKMEGNYLSTDQWKWEQELTKAGHDHGVWRPSDWDRIEEELA